VAEGKVVDDKIEGLFPDIEDPVIFVDGVRIWLNPVVPEEPFEEEEEEDSGDKTIEDMYWSYGKDQIPLEEDKKTRHYADLNLHVKTKNYADGETVEVTIKNDDGQPLFGDTKELKLVGTVSNDCVVFENVFDGYTLNR